jgi:hypothetical protein
MQTSGKICREIANLYPRHCEEQSDEAIHLSTCGAMDCFAEPVIGRRFAPTRWLAMTWMGGAPDVRNV